MIHGHRDLGHEARVPVQVARHVQSHSRALGERCHGAQDGPPVEDRRRRIRAESEEMVERPDVVEARLVADPPHLRLDVDGMYLLRKLQAVPEGIPWQGHVCRI